MRGSVQVGLKGAFLATVCVWCPWCLALLTVLRYWDSGDCWSGGELRSDPIFVTGADESLYKGRADRGGWSWLPSGHCRELTFREVTLQWFYSPGRWWLEKESQAEVWSCKECGGVRGAPEGGRAGFILCDLPCRPGKDLDLLLEDGGAVLG